MIIELNDISIQVTRKSIKRMHIRIYPHGEVKVSAPMHCSVRSIKHFVEEKKAWITTHHERIKKSPLVPQIQLQSGCMLPFKGNSHYLIRTEEQGRLQIHCDNGFIYCKVPPNTTDDELSYQLDCWYKNEMAMVIPELIRHWSAIIGVTVSQWGIKKMKTRWGSCNTLTHRIWLNLNLIKKPLPCLEYVLVHELTHLLEPSHNRRFYQLMDQYMPTWRNAHYILEGKKTKK